MLGYSSFCDFRHHLSFKDPLIKNGVFGCLTCSYGIFLVMEVKYKDNSP